MKSSLLFIALLLISIGLNSYLVLRRPQHLQRDFYQKYVELRTNYISLAKAQKNLMEVMFKDLDLKNEVGKVYDEAYYNLSDEKFQEAVRRKIVWLEMKVEEMQNE